MKQSCNVITTVNTLRPGDSLMRQCTTIYIFVVSVNCFQHIRRKIQFKETHFFQENVFRFPYGQFRPFCIKCRWFCSGPKYSLKQIWVNIGPGNGLLPDGTKALPKPMLTYHQLGSAVFTRANFNWTYARKWHFWNYCHIFQRSMS